MGLNVEKEAYAKYSKLAKRDNETTLILSQKFNLEASQHNQEGMEKKLKSGFENHDDQTTKVGGYGKIAKIKTTQKFEVEFLKRWKIGSKTLFGFSLMFLMLVFGFIAGLLVMDMEIQSLIQQNQNLEKELKSQEKIAKEFKAQNQAFKVKNQNLLEAQNMSQAQITKLILQNKNQMSKYELAAKYLQKILKNNSHLLHDAVRDGDIEELNLFLNVGAKVDARDDSLETPLHYAVREDKDEIAEILIQNGAYVDAVNKNGKSPLNLAVDKGHLNIVEIMLRHGVDGSNITNMRTKNTNHTYHLLHEAADKGYPEVAKLLLENGADVDVRAFYNYTPLFYASKKGHVKVAKVLLENGADSNARQFDQNTPLHYAAINGHLEIAKLLLQNEADVNAIDEHQESPLHYAISDVGHAEIAELLIQNGADVNAREERGITPLHFAASNGFSIIVEILLKHGAKRDLKNNEGMTPLQDAEHSREGDYEQVITLLKTV